MFKKLDTWSNKHPVKALMLVVVLSGVAIFMALDFQAYIGMKQAYLITGFMLALVTCSVASIAERKARENKTESK